MLAPSRSCSVTRRPTQSFSGGPAAPTSDPCNSKDWLCLHSRPQVHPELLTKALLARVEQAGGAVQLAAVTGVEAAGGRVAALTVRDRASGEERRLQAEAVVFAMGAPAGPAVCFAEWAASRWGCCTCLHPPARLELVPG